MIKIYSFYNKRSDFLDLQISSFQKHLRDQYEFIVFNNSSFDPNRVEYNKIKQACQKNNIQCIDIEKDKDLIQHLQHYNNEIIINGAGYTNGNIAHAYGLCFAWKHIISKTNDLVCVIDNDMFFVGNENITALLNKYDLVYMEQSKGSANKPITYMWPNIILANLDKLPEKETINWWCGQCEGVSVDVGGHSYYYLEKHKNNLKISTIKQYHYSYDPECNFEPANYEYLSLDGNKSILHYRGGSNWDGQSQDYHNKKTQWLKNKLKG